MIDLSHFQLLLILGLCLIPAVWQFLTRLEIHGLWLAIGIAAGIFTVVMW